jgi:hypothetical protein
VPRIYMAAAGWLSHWAGHPGVTQAAITRQHCVAHGPHSRC